MKNLLIVICLTLALISCKKETENKLTSKNNSASITYNTIKPIDSFRLLKAVNGKHYHLFQSKIDTTPTFKINIDKAQLISINGTSLFVEPNENYTINEINPYENINEYSGKNSAGQEFLNTLKTKYKHSLAAQSIKNNTIEQAYKKVNTTFQIDYNRLDSLYSNKFVSTVFQQTVKQKLDFDLALTQARIIHRNFIRAVRDTINTKKEFKQNDIALFNKLYKEYPVNNSTNQGHLYWYDYTKSYICTSNIINTKQHFKYTLDEQFSNHSKFLNVAKQLLNKETLEYFTACYLFENFINYHYSKDLVSEYEKFKKEYPNSLYLSYLIKNTETINEYPSRINQPISSKIEFVKNSKSINTLEKLINLTKGKNTYLVFWKDDFSESKIDFNVLLKSRPFFKKHDIDVVYLSINDLTNNKNVKDIIHYYSLEGKHLSINKELFNDIKSKTKKGRYPRYMIINKQGEIINDDAVWPRRIKYFEKELINALNL